MNVPLNKHSVCLAAPSVMKVSSSDCSLLHTHRVDSIVSAARFRPSHHALLHPLPSHLPFQMTRSFIHVAAKLETSHIFSQNGLISKMPFLIGENRLGHLAVYLGGMPKYHHVWETLQLFWVGYIRSTGTLSGTFSGLFSPETFLVKLSFMLDDQQKLNLSTPCHEVTK